tara:strand:- start:411 stop:596 length:186 start_codon:yes stop_codon:yes gene_type:complete
MQRRKRAGKITFLPGRNPVLNPEPERSVMGLFHYIMQQEQQPFILQEVFDHDSWPVYPFQW